VGDELALNEGGDADGRWKYRSINTTFSVPLLDNVTTDTGARKWLESFIHLSGPYSIGDVNVDTYEYVADDQKHFENGPAINVLVQAIYRTSVDDVDWQSFVSDDTDVDGWEELQRTSVCLMLRTGKENETNVEDVEAQVKKKKRKDPFGARAGMGVGIYVSRPTVSGKSLAEDTSPVR
jgi:hypothetical protein